MYVFRSITINNLLQNQDACVLSIYCNYRTHKEQTIPKVLRSLWKQVARKTGSISANLLVIWEKYNNQQNNPTPEELVSHLQVELAKFAKVFIVVDALDEYNNNELGLLLQNIKDLSSHAQHFFTSRYPPDDQLDEISTPFPLSAQNDDLEVYISNKMRFGSAISNRLEKQQGNTAPLTKQMIVEKVLERAKSMYVLIFPPHTIINISLRFLLVVFHMEALGNQKTIKQLRKCLSELPNKLNHAYQEIMKRIEAQADAAKLAAKTLKWITFAEGQLDSDTLRRAVAIEEGDESFDEEAMPSIEDVLSSCAGLVVVDGAENEVKLVRECIS